MVFHFFGVSAVLLSDLDHFLPILEGPLWVCDSFVSGPLLACEGPLRPTDGPPAWQRTTGGPLSEPDDPLSTWEGPPVRSLPNRRALCRSGRVFCRERKVWRALCRPESPLSVWEGPLSAERALCQSERALQSVLCQFWGLSVGRKGGPLSDWEAHCWAERALCRAERALNPSSANSEGPLSAVRALCEARRSSVVLRGPSSLSSANF